MDRVSPQLIHYIWLYVPLFKYGKCVSYHSWTTCVSFLVLGLLRRLWDSLGLDCFIIISIFETGAHSPLQVLKFNSLLLWVPTRASSVFEKSVLIKKPKVLEWKNRSVNFVGMHLILRIFYNLCKNLCSIWIEEEREKV